ncbi:unnamed protein product, partial [Ectocarpus sp. 6 AP-2014]
GAGIVARFAGSDTRCCGSPVYVFRCFFFRNGHPHPRKQHANGLSVECDVMRGRFFPVLQECLLIN